MKKLVTGLAAGVALTVIPLLSIVGYLPKLLTADQRVYTEGEGWYAVTSDSFVFRMEDPHIRPHDYHVWQEINGVEGDYDLSSPVTLPTHTEITLRFRDEDFGDSTTSKPLMLYFHSQPRTGSIMWDAIRGTDDFATRPNYRVELSTQPDFEHAIWWAGQTSGSIELADSVTWYVRARLYDPRIESFRWPSRVITIAPPGEAPPDTTTEPPPNLIEAHQMGTGSIAWTQIDSTGAPEPIFGIAAGNPITPGGTPRTSDGLFWYIYFGDATPTVELFVAGTDTVAVAH